MILICGALYYWLKDDNDDSKGKGDVQTPRFSIFEPRNAKKKSHHLCSSSGEGEGSNSDLPDDALLEASFGERWSDHTYFLNKLASSLEEEGLIRDEHLKELKSVGNALVYIEIPDLDEVVKEAARARIEKHGSDPVAAQAQDVLSNLDVARNAAHFLQNEGKDLPGEGKARASQLSQILNCDIIPAINNVIVSYKDLREAAAPFEWDSADNSMDSDADSTILPNRDLGF